MYQAQARRETLRMFNPTPLPAAVGFLFVRVGQLAGLELQGYRLDELTFILMHLVQRPTGEGGSSLERMEFL